MSSMTRHVGLMAASFALVLDTATAEAKFTTSEVRCLNDQKCQSLSNGVVAVTVTRDVGPRILSYGFVGKSNVFAEMPLPQGQAVDPKKFYAWGGQRLWHAPEERARTYEPDNQPVVLEALAPGRIRLSAAPEARTGLQKRIEVVLDPAGTRVIVRHTLTNHGLFAVEAAPWAIAVMKGGGSAIVPNEPQRPHAESLQPVRSMALWSYTDLSDPRFLLGPRLLRLRSDEAFAQPQKVGFGNRQGWVAYHRERSLFVKHVAYDERATYADFGSNVEIYTAGDFIEVETLGPLKRIPPRGEVAHQETWFLFDDVELSQGDEAAAATLETIVRKTTAAAALPKPGVSR